MPTVRGRYARATERTFGGAVILAALLAFGAPAYFFLAYMPSQRRATIEALTRELAARTDQRQMGLERWVQDGFQSAATVAAFPAVRSLVSGGAARRRPRGGDEAAHVNDILVLYARTQGLQRVLVVDAHGDVEASGQSAPVLAAGERLLLRRAIATEAQAVGFHMQPVTARPAIGFATPVMDARGRPAGAILLEADPEEWVYPFLLAAQPLPEPSSEAVLVEQYGDSVVWASPRRKSHAPLLSDRRLLSETRDLPIHDALLGGSRFGAYTDYAGTAVFASTRRIRGTPWGLVVKVDQADVLRPLDARLRHEAAGRGTALVALLGLAATLWWNARRAVAVEVERGLARQGAALDQANDMVLFVGLDGRIEGANRRAEAFYGSEGLIGRGVVELRAPELRDDASSALAAVRDGAPLVIETVHLAADGTRVPVEVSARRVHLDGGDQIVSVIRDIRDRTAAEAAVRSSEGRYRSLFQGMLEGYAHCRVEFEGDVPRDWVYLDVNPAFVAITGITDAVGKRATEVIPGIRETNPELFEIYGRVARTGEPSQVESYVPALGVWFSLAVYCPAPGEFVAVFENVTERRRAFDELRRREHDLEDAERIGRVGSYVFDLSAGRWSSSPMLDDLFGIGAEFDRNVAGWLAIVHADDRAAMAEYLQTEVLARRARFDREYRIVRLSDGAERWVYGRGELTLDAAGSPAQMAGMIQDVTERRRAEQEILDLNAALEKRVEERTAELAQAIAGLERANNELEAFAYSVSHDLQAPLRAIDGFSRMLEEDHAPRLDDEGRRLLEVVRRNTREMAQLIRDLLAFSQAGRGALQRSQVDMERLARSAWEALTTPAERRTIAFRLDALPPASCDPALMRLVWTNLLANAVKFTAPKPERVVEVHSREDARSTTYVVKDNGVGFDTRYSDKLFGVFQRLHSATEFAGTGVGLALVQRIVHRHDGVVGAEGVVGEGATFTFTLPREGGPA